MSESTRQVRIGQLARQLGLNPKTIRYYESIGLLRKPARTEAGYRLYDADDRERLAFIRKAQAVGLTLDEIGQLLALHRNGEMPRTYVGDLVDQKLAAVDAQLRALQDFRDDLLALRAEVEQADETACAEGQVCGLIELYHPEHLDYPTPLSLRRTTSRR
jgi:DNA-binding transcriptional MerR regulator